ncbi:MAG: YggT family protein [Zetaproteobacteria bacterium]|nr:YggT family protein [Zetaproteobacteria bacterium]
MIYIGYLVQALAGLLDMALTLVMFVVIARAVLSWVSPDPHNPIVHIINQISEPILFPIRQRVPYMGGMDLSPIIALMIIFFLQTFLVQSLQHWAAKLIY